MTINMEKTAMRTGMTQNTILIVPSLLLIGMLACAGCMQNTGPALPSTKSVPVGGPGTFLPDTKTTLSCAGSPVSRVNESPGYSALLEATELLTKPEKSSVTVSIVPNVSWNILVLYGTSSGSYFCQTPAVAGSAGSPAAITVTGLAPDTLYYYRICLAVPASSEMTCGPENTFHTQRPPNSTFTFGIQADSHPEREKTMFSADLYRQTLQNVAGEKPDFYISLGDDFSIDPLISKNQATLQNVDAVYLGQRTYLDTVGNSSPLFLVNGNHEQAARYLLDGTASNPAVLAGNARMQYFPQPVPDSFYTGDTEPVPFVGLPGDYYAWTWGDALFVVIDPYWHSDIAVDSVAGGREHQKKDMWDITLGSTQYSWLRKTLEESNATYKFVFTHHILGTGRGGIEEAGLYEWGGQDQKGTAGFAAKRPGWEMPIRQLMAKTGVTIFFQGHDHLFARQELDGVVYQEVPVPADFTLSTFNADAYTSGVKLPNTGYLRVSVSPQNTTVQYIHSFLPDQETATERNGMVAYSYVVRGKTQDGGTI